MTTTILILAIVVLGVQIGMFFAIRAKKKKLTAPSELEKKYNIQSRSDAWTLLNNPDLPEGERKKIESLYKKM